jgi:small-conductance mechanosensitive channel
MQDLMPSWLQEWMSVVVPVLQVGLIVLVAWVVQRQGRQLIRQTGEHNNLPPEVTVIGRRVLGFVVWGAAILLILERLGVSGSVLWTAFTGFAAVAAVAFFAAWSVLSNIFCTILIFATRPFRLNDHIELLEGADKPGLKGRVIDINLIYTTIQETTPEGGMATSVLQIPNNLFFQRTLRRMRNDSSR